MQQCPDKSLRSATGLVVGTGAPHPGPRLGRSRPHRPVPIRVYWIAVKLPCGLMAYASEMAALQDMLATREGGP